jgi:AcrR family transcriptional regulator
MPLTNLADVPTAELPEPAAEILRAAVAQIAVSGYERVRLRDIAVAAGVSIGLLQHYFDTREALLAQAFTRHCDELTAGWAQLRDADAAAWPRLVELVDRVARHPELRLRAAVWTELAAAAARHEELRPALARAYGAWRELIASIAHDGVASGAFAPAVPVDDAVDALLATIDGALLAVAGGVAAMTGERLAALVLGVARELLGAEEAA